MSQGGRWTLAALLGASSLTMMAGAVLSPALPDIRQHFADTPSVELLSRLVLTLPALFIALCASPAGWVADRCGRRTLLLLATGAFALAGASGFVLDDLIAILIGRALLGVAAAAVMTCSTALIADYFTGDERARVMGWQGAATAFGGVFFFALGGVLADMGWRAPFLIYLAALVLVPLVHRLPEPGCRDDHGAARPGQAAWEWPSLTLLATLYLVALDSMVAVNVIPVQLAFHLRELGVTGATRAGLAVALYTLFGGFSSLGYRRIEAYLGHRLTLAATFVLSGLSLWIVSFADSYTSIMLAMVVVVVGLGLLLPNLNTCVMTVASGPTRGRIAGGLTAAAFLGQFLSPVATQPIVASLGLSATFAFTGGVLLALATVASATRLLGCSGRGRDRRAGTLTTVRFHPR